MLKSCDDASSVLAFLNGKFQPLEDIKISPLDRGFLFGDGIYEVIPMFRSSGGAFTAVGLDHHFQRLCAGCDEVKIPLDWSFADFSHVVTRLAAAFQSEQPMAIESNGNGIGVYLQVTRGPVAKRSHAFPATVHPTYFAYPFLIDKSATSAVFERGSHVLAAKDLRWQRCHIKSISLLGNVLHHQEALESGADEVLLLNSNEEVSEASISNVFVMNGQVVKTPKLNNKLLAGVTRRVLMDILNQHSSYEVTEDVITLNQLLSADCAWLCSSTKELMPISAITVNDQTTQIGRGQFDAVYQLYQTHKLN